MRLSVVIAVVLYEVIVIIGVSWFLNRHQKEKISNSEFVSSGGSMSTVAVGATMALTSLGGAHILGLPAQAASTGVATYWFALASAMMMVILCCYVGPWYKRFGFTTVAHVFEKLYDRRVAVLLSGLTAGCTWGVISLEMQGIGTVISAMTGWSIIMCCIVGGVISFLYVVFAGMKEVAWVNVVNAVFMYIGVIIATVYLGRSIDGGWQGVNNYYTSSGNGWMLSLWANGETWRTYIIGTILGSLFFVPMNQAGCQCSISAKNVKVLKRSVLIAVPLNCIFGVFMIAFGMAANTMPQYTANYGGPMVTFAMLVELLPTWVLIWLLAGFVAAILSTIAVCVLGVSTIFVEGIVKQYYKPKMDDATSVRWLRVALFVVSAVTCLASTLLPPINTSMVWLFAWLLPPFWMFVFGMHWKRSTRAALGTIIISAIANCVWTFSDLDVFFNLQGTTNSLVMLVFTMVVGLILVATDKNAKPGLIRLYKQDKSQFINQKEEVKTT